MDEVLHAIRRERPSELVQAVTALADSAAAPELPGREAAQYFALCERAWLHWTRAALDAITTQTVGHATLGPFNPAHVRDGRSAAEAAVRCGLHRKLLDVGSWLVSDPDWPWRMEAANQVHFSTEKALQLAARPGLAETASVAALNSGVSRAVDAVVTAIAAGFISDGASEMRATVEAMRLAGTDFDIHPSGSGGPGEWQRLGGAIERSS